MTVKTKIGLTLLIIIFMGCSNSSTLPSNKINAGAKPLLKSEVIKQECNIPNYFWTSAVKVAENEHSPIILIQLMRSKDSKAESALFECRTREILASGDDKNQIIDFLFLEDSSLVILRSFDSGIPDPWIGTPLRELKIEKISDTTSSITFFDSNQNDAVKYDLDGNEKSSKALDKDKTLLFASFSTLKIGKLYPYGNGFVLSYVGTGGYRLATFNSVADTNPTIHELMPNTISNSDFFDREAAPLDVVGDWVYSALGVSPPDSMAIKKRFAKEVVFSSSLKRQVLVSKMNLSSQERILKVFAGEHSAFPESIDVEKDIGSLLFNEIGSNQRLVTVDLFNPLSLESIGKAHSPSPEMSAAQTMKICNDRIWVGGNSGFHQVSTGSVVKFGDAFLWSIDTRLNSSELKLFGTDRNDSITDIVCSKGGVIVGGNENGPITHTGDSDSSLLYQQGFVGLYE